MEAYKIYLHYTVTLLSSIKCQNNVQPSTYINVSIAQGGHSLVALQMSRLFTAHTLTSRISHRICMNYASGKLLYLLHTSYATGAIELQLKHYKKSSIKFHNIAVCIQIWIQLTLKNHLFFFCEIYHSQNFVKNYAKCSSNLIHSKLCRKIARSELKTDLKSIWLLTSKIFDSGGVTRVGVTRGGKWRCHPYFFPQKKKLLTLSIADTFIDFTRMSPPGGCHPSPFYLSDLVCPLFFVNLPTIFFRSGVTPSRVSPGEVRSLVMPLIRHPCQFFFSASSFNNWYKHMYAHNKLITLELLNLPHPPSKPTPPSKISFKNWLLPPPGVHLQLTPINYANIFLASGLYLHPLQSLGWYRPGAAVGAGGTCRHVL